MKKNQLTVKEIKDMIEEMQDNDIISFQMISGCCYDYEDLDNPDISDYYPPSKRELGCKVITFDSLPGYKSCIQVGQTKDADKKRWEKVKGK